MKMRTLIFFIPFLFAAFPAIAASHEITLNPVTAANIERCAVVPSGLKSLKIGKVVHKGADESVGVIKKKGEVEQVFVVNDVKQVVADSVRNTLAKCGYKLGDGADALTVELVITDFFTRAENEGVTGKDTAAMNLSLRIGTPDRDVDYQIDYGIEKSAKTAPFFKAKRFQKILGATLSDVMNQIALSDSLAATLKAASEPVAPAEVVKENGVIIYKDGLN